MNAWKELKRVLRIHKYLKKSCCSASAGSLNSMRIVDEKNATKINKNSPKIQDAKTITSIVITGIVHSRMTRNCLVIHILQNIFNVKMNKIK